MEEEDYKETSINMQSLDYILAGTDGLIQLANNLQVNTISLVYYLLNNPATKTKSILKDSTDDVLIFKFQLTPDLDMEKRQFSLVHEMIPGNEFQIIDAYQEKWERSLKLSFEDRLEDKLNDILHCAREAALLSLNVACEKLKTQYCTVQIVYSEYLQKMIISIIRDGDSHLTDKQKRNNHIEKKRQTTEALNKFASCSIEESYTSIQMEFRLDLSYQKT